MSIIVTVAQLRTIVERADIEEADGFVKIEIDEPSRDDPGDWQDPVRVLRDGSGPRPGIFLFAVDGDGLKLDDLA